MKKVKKCGLSDVFTEFNSITMLKRSSRHAILRNGLKYYEL